MILGLTVGVASIGWALLDDKKIIAQGVRAFVTGTTGTSNPAATQHAIRSGKVHGSVVCSSVGAQVA